MYWEIFLFKYYLYKSYIFYTYISYVSVIHIVIVYLSVIYIYVFIFLFFYFFIVKVQLFHKRCYTVRRFLELVFFVWNSNMVGCFWSKRSPPVYNSNRYSDLYLYILCNLNKSFLILFLHTNWHTFSPLKIFLVLLSMLNWRSGCIVRTAQNVSEK